MKSVSQASKTTLFRRDSQTLKVRAARTALSSNVHQFCIPKSSCRPWNGFHFSWKFWCCMRSMQSDRPKLPNLTSTLLLSKIFIWSLNLSPFWVRSILSCCVGLFRLEAIFRSSFGLYLELRWTALVLFWNLFSPLFFLSVRHDPSNSIRYQELQINFS